MTTTVSEIWYIWWRLTSAGFVPNVRAIRTISIIPPGEKLIRRTSNGVLLRCIRLRDMAIPMVNMAQTLSRLRTIALTNIFPVSPEKRLPRLAPITICETIKMISGKAILVIPLTLIIAAMKKGPVN